MKLLYNHRNEEVGTLATTKDGKNIEVMFNDDNHHVDTMISVNNIEKWKQARGFKEVENMTGEQWINFVSKLSILFTTRWGIRVYSKYPL